MNCKFGGCCKNLNRNNVLGYCRKHRYMAPRKAWVRPWQDQSARRRAYYLAHREEEIASAKAWRESNPERYRACKRICRRREREREALRAAAEWRAERKAKQDTAKARGYSGQLVAGCREYWRRVA